jgi:tRNA pseudouridine38-40 synthase
MPRYFLEVSYKGTAYSGFQVQANAISIQAEIEKVFAVFFRRQVMMTGASRTDTGVHARQNYFHFDFEEPIAPESVYRLNAILPGDICIKGIFPVPEEAHCRFDAESREYRDAIASRLMEFTDFTSFSKRNTQVKHFRCTIHESHWVKQEGGFYYRIRANRFLRGMVRGLTGTMLKAGRGQLTGADFDEILEGKDPARVNFNVPAKGLFLERVRYPEQYNLERR